MNGDYYNLLYKLIYKCMAQNYDPFDQTVPM